MVIHLIAPKDQSKWSKKWHYCYKSWKYCPYEIKMWHDENIDQLLREDDEEFFNTLSSLPSIYKWDYVRYIILEKFGGSYFDMDVEIIDPSFFKKLDPYKIYIMEGTNGSIVENSIIISCSSKIDSIMWGRLKLYVKHTVLNNLKKCKLPINVINYVGPNILSEYFIKYLPNFNINYEILSYPQFGSITNEISFTRHYQTSNWI